MSTHNNCRFVRPWKRPAGNSVILLPYRTLQTKRARACLLLSLNRAYLKCINRKRKDTHRDSRDFNPWNASAATFFIWLLLRSLHANEKPKTYERIKHFIAVERQSARTCILEKLGHERHSHSSQFSVRRESLGRNFRDAVLLQPPADNQGKNKLYRNKLTNSRTGTGGRFIGTPLLIARCLLGIARRLVTRRSYEK